MDTIYLEKGTVVFHLTSGEEIKTFISVEWMLYLAKNIRDHSFIDVNNNLINKINIAYIEFPGKLLLSDLIDYVSREKIYNDEMDYGDLEFLTDHQKIN